MITRDTIQRFLEDSCGPYIELEFEFESSEKFRFVIRCKLGKHKEDYKGFCKTFVDNFSSFTNTNWIVRSSFPNLKRLAYRKMYKCQHNSFNKKSVPRLNRERARGCNATLDLTFKLVNKHTCRNDQALKEGYCVVIKVSYCHSHEINAATAYSFLRSSDETDDRFKEYFKAGITPAAAIVLHEMSIIEKYGKESSVHLANAQVNPSERHVYYLYTNWRKANIIATAGLDINEVIESRLTALREKDFIFEYKLDPINIVVISPIMQRIYEHNTARDVLYIDTSSACDQTNAYITAVFAISKIGVLPIAFALHSSQVTSSYTLAFSMIKESLEKKFDGIKMNPAVIITDSNTAARNALKSLFPKAQIPWCSFHVAQSLWRWLTAPENGIHITKRPSIMSHFTKIMFAGTQYNAEKLFKDLISDGYVKCCSNLIVHLHDIWDNKNEWCTPYRKNALHSECKIKYTEASMRIFRDVILQRCKALNLFAMVDFLSNIFENYLHRRIFKYAHNREINNFAYLKFYKETKDVEITRVSDTEFMVESTAEKDVKYTVDMETVCCDCTEGRSGAFCKHLCAVESEFGYLLKSCPELSSTEREIFVKIACEEEELDEFIELSDYLGCPKHPESSEHSQSPEPEDPESLEHSEALKHPDCPEHPQGLEHVETPEETYEFMYEEDSNEDTKDQLISKVKEEPDIKPNVETDIEFPAEPNLDLNASECLIPERNNAFILHETADPAFNMTYNEALAEMEVNINKIRTIFKRRPCWSNLEAIHLFNKRLKTVTTDADAQDFVFNNFKTEHPLEKLEQTTAVPKWKRKHEEAFRDSN
ncbi:uncharacterized protein LOC115455969 isoform X1 [Manduca sexta]|uniref:SWIM-type domain-containing protein n=1 Tax=Manduca sexta TaxID=7130 RepID=A0A921YRU3_MANSE|nr:uncharacterized protein LOC115455969 isoform X1 [Manduca sexta]KAG6443537.1 hypothetical protein O3G_MSEX002918 [Manduca sexta]